MLAWNRRVDSYHYKNKPIPSLLFDLSFRTEVNMKSYAALVLVLWLEIFAVSLLLAGIIVGSYGAATYWKNSKDEVNYRPWKTMCYVRNYTLNVCDRYDQCLCFDEEYLVEYEIFNKTKLTSRIQTKTRTTSPSPKVNDTCYYNGRFNLTSVKWIYGDKTTGFILFRMGLGIVGIVLPIMVFLYKFFYSHIAPSSFTDNYVFVKTDQFNFN